MAVKSVSFKPLPQIDFTDGGIVIDEKVIGLRERHAQILRRLFLARGDTVPVERLITTVWPDPDVEPENAVAALRTEIHRLRNQLRPFGLTVRNEHRSGYRLVTVDTSRHATEDVDRLALRLGVSTNIAAKLCKDAGTSASRILQRIGQPGGRKRGGPYGQHSRPN